MYMQTDHYKQSYANNVGLLAKHMHQKFNGHKE